MSEYEKICSVWKELNIDSKEKLEKHMDNFKILFAYHSGNIENEEITYDNTREIFESDSVSSFAGQLRTLFEIQNQKICYEYLIDKILEKEPLSQSLIKKIHKKLARGTYDNERYNKNGERPGEYKKHFYVTGPEEVGFPPEEVEEAIEAVIEEINSNENYSPLQEAAYLHAWFEYIHPFADANGRTGRTLVNYHLMINDHPPIIIYNDDKKRYLEALRAFDDKEDLRPLIAYLKEATIRTWQRLLPEKESSNKKKIIAMRHMMF